MLRTTIAHYKITTKLGQGGMGEVYRATDTKLGREVAIKVLPMAMNADGEHLARFQREGELLTTLNHPNITAIHGLEESGRSKALILELEKGDALADRLKKGLLVIEDALETCLGMAEALEAAHEKGIIHCDWKAFHQPETNQVIGKHPNSDEESARYNTRIIDFFLRMTAEK